MTKAKIAGSAAAALLILLALASAYRALERDVHPGAARSAATSPAAQPADVHPSFLYGRVTTLGGATYEGRLRFGGDEESFWGAYFNGVKKENPWVAHVPPASLPKVRGQVEIFGIKVRGEERNADLARPFMARFGDIARIDARGTDARVTLKSGTASDLNRFDASDYDDGVRVWDAGRGMVDLDSKLIVSIELLPSPRPGPAPNRLHGTVRTRRGNFTGFIQWDREESLGTDELDGRALDGTVTLRFDTIRSIARESPASSRVTLRDGREIVLSGTSEAGKNNRGLYVDDPRYGRVLVSWDAFERVDFGPAGDSGPAYGDFPPGSALTGAVITGDGRRLAGRLVYDLDESETTETLDAPSEGVNYTILFGLIGAVVPHGSEAAGAGRATVTLHSGEELQLERSGDLGAGNGGMLIFIDGRERTEYVPWAEVARIELERPPAMYPPLVGNPEPSPKPGK